MSMDIVEGKWTIMNMNERIWKIWTFVGTFKNEIFFRTFLSVRKKLMWMSKIVPVYQFFFVKLKNWINFVTPINYKSIVNIVKTCGFKDVI